MNTPKVSPGVAFLELRIDSLPKSHQVAAVGNLPNRRSWQLYSPSFFPHPVSPTSYAVAFLYSYINLTLACAKNPHLSLVCFSQPLLKFPLKRGCAKLTVSYLIPYPHTLLASHKPSRRIFHSPHAPVYPQKHTSSPLTPSEPFHLPPPQPFFFHPLKRLMRISPHREYVYAP